MPERTAAVNPRGRGDGEIEEMRALNVRGDQEGGEAAARRACELPVTVKQTVDSALSVGEDTKER